jgi:predicted alpha/beta hydrolase
MSAFAVSSDSAAASVAGRELTVPAEDGRMLAATLYEPASLPAPAHYTGSVDRSVWRITPSDVDVAKIGHFGFFRPEMRETLWRQAADWLLP